MSELSLGSLSYDVIAKMDQAYRDIEAFEAKFKEKQVSWRLDIDTTAADAKIASLEQRAASIQSGMGGGGGWSGSGAGGFTQSRASMAYGAASGYVQPIPGATPIADGDDDDDSPRRGGGMAGMRGLMLFHLGLQAVRGLSEAYDAREEQDHIDSMSGNTMDIGKRQVSELKKEKGIFMGLPSMIRDARAWITGESTSGDIERGIDTDEEADKKIKAQLAKAEKYEKAMLKQTEHADALDDQLAVERAGDGPAKGLARIDSAYKKMVDRINDEANKADDLASTANEHAQVQQRRNRELNAAASMRAAEDDKIIGDMNVRDAAKDIQLEHRRNSQSGDISTRLDADLKAAKDSSLLKLEELAARHHNDPDYEHRAKQIEDEERLDEKDIYRKHNIDFIRNDQAAGDRIREMNVGTDAIASGSRYASQIEAVKRIKDDTIREDSIQHLLERDDRSRRVDQLGISELQRMQAQLTNATSTGEVNANYTNFQDKNSDLADLLKQIKDAIDQLNFRMGS